MSIRIRRDLIYVTALLMDMSSGSARLGIPFFAFKLGASPLIIGIMASVNVALYVLFCLFSGKISDRVNRKRLPQISCIALTIIFFLVPQCKSLTSLFIVFSLSGIALSGFWPALEAWIGERGDGRPLMKRVRLFNLSWTAGMMIGYFISGYIYELHQFAPFYFAGIGTLCAFFVITAQPDSKGHFHKQSANLPSIEPENGALIDPKLATRYLYLGWAANFIGWLTVGVIRFIFPTLIDSLGMSPSTFGILMVCQASAQGIMFYVLGSTEKWHYKFSPLLIFQLLGAFGFLFVWLFDVAPIWAFGLLIIGLNNGMTYFSSIYYSLSGNVNLGHKSGWHESILSTGALIGPLIGGALANYAGMKTPYIFCAAISIVGLPVQLFILRRK